MAHIIWNRSTLFQPWHKIQNDFIDQLDGTKERIICQWHVCCWEKWSLIEALRWMHWRSWLHHAQSCSICFMYSTDTRKSRFLNHSDQMAYIIGAILYGAILYGANPYEGVHIIWSMIRQFSIKVSHLHFGCFSTTSLFKHQMKTPESVQPSLQITFWHFTTMIVQFLISLFNLKNTV